MICNNCKHKLPDDSEFCQYCGSKVEEIKTIDDSVIDSDTGDKYFSNFSLPEGTYNITITRTSYGSTRMLYIKDNGKTIASTSGQTYVVQLKINAMTNTILGITTYYTDEWTITIEAVGN